MKAAIALAVVVVVTAAYAAALPAPFSGSAPGGALPPGWIAQELPRSKPSRVDLVHDEGVTVLRVRSQGEAGGAVYAMKAPAQAVLRWRWKVDRVVEGADMSVRAGDDYAARVYVFFDVPEETLSWGERAKIRLARLLHGARLPTAALCYVWDNRHPPGTTAWNPYTERVRMIVVESGAERAGRWVAARRDLEADFRAAFGTQWRGPVPEVTGIAAGNDTDQTGASATAWFGDFVLEGRG
ncbi:MAG TPA: DUF3047 domain-containing protein [Usitatibacter sp.]|nr:DUF3047 domain-containing protein [Usitatibacter sp.]